MAKLKLPEPLKAWKVVSRLSDTNGKELYQVTKNENGSKISAVLHYIVLEGEKYSEENAAYFAGEADFIQSISQLDGVSCYIDACTEDNPNRKKVALFIILEEASPLSDILQSREFSEKEVVDFGLQISEILDKLETKKIFHGNINPSNIFVTADGMYKLGGFIDAESSIDDFSYAAPEIRHGEQADFTTDIYSLGLIMYTMCNFGKLPFESDGTSREEATVKRFEAKSVNAPKNGSEKLKSVIVIACQPDNQNRWKNAGNIKNALASIKADLPANPTNTEVIVPESTDFDSNVFEEYTYEELESTEPAQTAAQTEEAPQAVSVEDTVEPVEEITEEFSENASEEKAEVSDEYEEGFEEIVSSYQAPEIDNRVFDDYEAKAKVINISDEHKDNDKDYGDYFEDYDEDEAIVEEQAKEQPVAASNSSSFNENAFITETDGSDSEETKKNRKGLVAAIIVGIVILLALLGAFGVLAVRNGLFSGSSNTNNKVETTAATEAATSTTEASTTQPTTSAPTTAPPTEVSEKYVIPVVGYGYYYAKELLEAEGFVVEVGEYMYSDDYDEGYVISQSPSGDTNANEGSTITLDVSLGAESSNEEETTEAVQVNGNSSSAYSSYKNNTSYLSQAEVDAMSKSELNLALNEIYARRGRIFTDPELAAYFNAQSWYTPMYSADEFSKNVVFNDYEEKNINLIVNEQTERGYR